MDKSLNFSDKAALFDKFLNACYEVVIHIDRASGNAETLYSKDPVWDVTIGNPYPFEETFNRYLANYLAISDRDFPFMSVSLEDIRLNVTSKHDFPILYTIQGPDGGLHVKEGLFFRDDSSIWLFIADITQSYEKADKRIHNLNDAVSLTTAGNEEKNAIYSIMQDSLRKPLYSTMGILYISGNTREDANIIGSYVNNLPLSGMQLNEFIEDINDLKQIAEDRLVLKPEPVRLQKVLKDIHSVMKTVCEDRGYLFSSSQTIISEADVYLDSHLFSQLMYRILQIILASSVRGSRIHMFTQEFPSPSGRLTCEFSLECTGVILDAERMSVLIRPYDLIKEIAEKNPDSFDVSSVILKYYLSLFGAETLIIESDGNRGSRISFILSFDMTSQTRKQAEEVIERLAPKLKGIRVLIVDDNDVTLDIEERLLSGYGIYTERAINGQDAINVFTAENGNFDVILMDILMPDTDGLEATRRIRRLKDVPGAETIPVIAMTVGAFRKDFKESLDAGMNAHLIKPINPERLFTVLCSVLGRE
ncbi:MAG TPA: hypothetical protein DCL38_01930 [Lachnospiraceae bacterium]|nr:hypothetical protein [Lachnospiraceae bacterium]